MVPNEDTGTFFVAVSMPPATSLEKTQAAMARIDSLLAATPGLKSRTEIAGYSFMAGQGSAYGTFICKLKPWEERTKEQNVDAIMGMLTMQTRNLIKDAQVFIFAPPMISGYSASNGFEVNLQDKTGGDINTFFNISQQFIGKLNQRPEIAMAYSAFNPFYPQYMVDIDVAKCKQAGLSPQTLLAALQGYYGSIYASNFNRFGRLYRVMIQSDAELRVNPETLNSIKVRNGNEMAPITQFITLKRVYGPDNISRFNMFTSIKVNGNPKPGYSSGQAIQAIQEVANETLPSGYGFEYSGMTREEQQSSGSTTAIIMLIGLLAKNAILITEFALERRQSGMSIVSAAVLGASARLRPILMTSLAMVIGLLPLMFASGVGANGNSTLGTGAIGGMLIGMICQIFVVPALFVAFQHLQERFKPLHWDDTDNTEIEAEIEQYTK